MTRPSKPNRITAMFLVARKTRSLEDLTFQKAQIWIRAGKEIPNIARQRAPNNEMKSSSSGIEIANITEKRNNDINNDQKNDEISF